jgi:hypothetical protein
LVEKGIIATLLLALVFVLNLIPYALAWLGYSYLQSVFTQLPELGFVKFMLVVIAIKIIWSVLFGERED